MGGFWHLVWVGIVGTGGPIVVDGGSSTGLVLGLVLGGCCTGLVLGAGGRRLCT